MPQTCDLWACVGKWAGLLAVLVSGCAQGPISLTDNTKARVGYEQVLEHHSRTGRVLSKTEFDTDLLVVATLRSKAFQRAFVGRLLTTYAVLDPWEQSRIEKEQTEQTQTGLSLFVLSKTHTASWNELRPQMGKWRLSLRDDQGREVQADKVEGFSSRQTVQLALLGAGQDPFAKLWAVHFPDKASDGQPFPLPSCRKIRLRVAGPLGQTELSWSLQ